MYVWHDADLDESFTITTKKKRQEYRHAPHKTPYNITLPKKRGGNLNSQSHARSEIPKSQTYKGASLTTARPAVRTLSSV